MTVAEADLTNFEGPGYDAKRIYSPDLTPLLQDHARPSHPSPDRYQARVRSAKFCLACPHWANFHPGHGPCVSVSYYTHTQCPCTAFSDPEPGRPDQIYTRDQVDRMSRWRWEARKDRIFLLKNGYYGLWDQWSSEEWKAAPGQVSKPWLDEGPPTSPLEPTEPSEAPSLPPTS